MSLRLFTLAVLVLLATLVIVNQIYTQENTFGSVFTMTNSASGNEVIVFNRNSNGSLVRAGSFSTDGLGTGNGLGNQGAVRLSPSGRRLLVANPGSDEISMFGVNSGGLQLQQTISSGGQRPVSIAMRGNRIFVLNAGGMSGSNDNIAGFELNEQGRLTRIPSSTRSLSGPSTDPVQIDFTQDGQFLIVTERGANTITTFPVNFDGSTNSPSFMRLNGTTPIGFGSGGSRRVFVSESFSNGANASAISSFGFNSTGALEPISTSVPTFQTGASNVALTSDGRFGFVSNTGSDTISSFRINSDGSLTIIDSSGIAANTGPRSAPIEVATSNNFLFTLTSGTNQINTFQVSDTGSLTPFGEIIRGLPVGANGLAAQ